MISMGGIFAPLVQATLNRQDNDVCVRKPGSREVRIESSAPVVMTWSKFKPKKRR